MKFSNIELQHLARAWIAISLAFAILLSNGNFFSLTFLNLFLISGLTVGIGFLFHELSHKYLAQKYHCFAEFRAFDTMLVLAILMSFFGFIFAAPGAVMIKGYINTEKNGKVSVAGPVMNIILAIMFFIMVKLNILTGIANYGFFINSLLATFNMIPIWNFDGSKVLKWNKTVYFLTLIIAVFLLVLGYGVI